VLRRLILVGSIFAAPLSFLGESSLSITTPLGTRVEFAAAAFMPGEIVTIRLAPGGRERRVSVHWSGETVTLGPPGSGFEPFGLEGIDLGQKPGPVPISVAVLCADGTTEVARGTAEVLARAFPEKRLKVDGRYVTPPAELRERLQWEAELLRTVYGIASPRWLAEGPFGLPHEGEMALNFGERRVYNNASPSIHAGVDIAAPLGSPVRASNSGRVVLARYLYFSGRTVVIDHGLGLFTTYGHFSALKVARGDRVKKGDVIGLAGSTGRSTGPHLHWSARVRESRVDPRALLDLMPDAVSPRVPERSSSKPS